VFESDDISSLDFFSAKDLTRDLTNELNYVEEVEVVPKKKRGRPKKNQD